MRFLLSIPLPLLLILCSLPPFDSQVASFNDGFDSSEERRPIPMAMGSAADDNEVSGTSGATGAVWSPEDDLIDEKSLNDTEAEKLLKRTEAKLTKLKSEIVNATEKWKQKQKELASKVVEYEKAEAEFNKLNETAKQKTKELDGFKEIAKMADVELNDATKSLEKANSTLNTALKTLNEAEENINTTKARIEELESTEKRRDEQQAIANQLKLDITQLDADIEKIDGTIKVKTKKVSDCNDVVTQWTLKKDNSHCVPPGVGECKKILENLGDSERLLREAKDELTALNEEKQGKVENKTSTVFAKDAAEKEANRLNGNLKYVKKEVATENEKLRDMEGSKTEAEKPIPEARVNQKNAQDRLEKAEFAKSQADSKVTSATPPGGLFQEQKDALIAKADRDLLNSEKIRLEEEVRREKENIDDLTKFSERVNLRVVALKQDHEKRHGAKAGISTAMICGIVAAAIALLLIIIAIIVFRWWRKNKEKRLWWMWWRVAEKPTAPTEPVPTASTVSTVATPATTPALTTATQTPVPTAVPGPVPTPAPTPVPVKTELKKDPKLEIKKPKYKSLKSPLEDGLYDVEELPDATDEEKKEKNEILKVIHKEQRKVKVNNGMKFYKTEKGRERILVPGTPPAFYLEASDLKIMPRLTTDDVVYGLKGFDWDKVPANTHRAWVGREIEPEGVKDPRQCDLYTNPQFHEDDHPNHDLIKTYYMGPPRPMLSNEVLIEKIQDVFVEVLKKKKKYDFEKNFMLSVFNQVIPIFKDGDRLIRTMGTVRTAGDIHGQFFNLAHFFAIYGGVFDLETFKKQKFLFLGDYVDRGKCSTEVIMVLFMLKICFPENIILLRGNHENYKTNVNEGFFNELCNKMGENDGKIFHYYFNYVFGHMPLACLVEEKAFFSHGGIPERGLISSLDDINKLPKYIFDLTKNPYSLEAQITWNDVQIGGPAYEPSSRGCGKHFELQELLYFMNQFGLSMAKVWNGYEFLLGMRFISLFSATNYELKESGLMNFGAFLSVKNAEAANIDTIASSGNYSEEMFTHYYNKHNTLTGFKVKLRELRIDDDETMIGH